MKKTFEQYSVAQGWNLDSENLVLLDFIAKNKLEENLAVAAQEHAELENAEFIGTDEEYKVFMKSNPEVMNFEQISAIQGWNIEGQNMIIMSFIEGLDLKPQLDEYCNNYQ